MTALADPTGLLITQLRDDADVHCDRIKAGQPAKGWALGPDKYQRFVLLTRLGYMRGRHVPTQEVRYAVKCYGTTEQDATALAMEVSASLHAKGRRASAGGIVIFSSFDDSGEGAATDPDTKQPYETVVISVGALTETLSL